MKGVIFKISFLYLNTFIVGIATCPVQKPVSGNFQKAPVNDGFAFKERTGVNDVKHDDSTGGGREILPIQQTRRVWSVP